MGFMDWWSKNVLDDIFGIEIFNPPDSSDLPQQPPAPTTQMPSVIPSTISKEEGYEPPEVKRKRRADMGGRKKTIVAGDLTPETDKKINLLGRTA